MFDLDTIIDNFKAIKNKTESFKFKKNGYYYFLFKGFGIAKNGKIWKALSGIYVFIEVIGANDSMTGQNMQTNIPQRLENWKIAPSFITINGLLKGSECQKLAKGLQRCYGLVIDKDCQQLKTIFNLLEKK